MTGAEKFALARGMHDAAMLTGKPPQAQAWIRQQFDCCVNAIVDALLPLDADRRQFRALVARDNWLRENPFNDD